MGLGTTKFWATRFSNFLGPIYRQAATADGHGHETKDRATNIDRRPRTDNG